MQTTVTQAAKVLLDNDRVTVSEVVQEPNTVIAMHAHPPYIIYAKTANEARFTYPNGASEVIKLQPGQVVFRDAESHSVENIGKTTADSLVINLKK